MTPVAARRAPVTVRTRGAAVVLELSHALDPSVAQILIEKLREVVDARPERVDIDLRGLVSWTPDGACSLVTCREMCREVPEGLHFRTGRGAGREALLAAYS